VPEGLKLKGDDDVLGDILETLRFRGSIFFRSELAAPWGLSVEETGLPRFHIVLSGECYVGSNGSESIRAREMDIVMLPGGTPHWIADQPGRSLVMSNSAAEACELGNPMFQQGRITNRIMCGLVRFEKGASHPAIDALPELMHFGNDDTRGAIWRLVDLIDEEVTQGSGRHSRVADRLTEILFVKLLNRHVETSSDVTGFVAALRDRRVHRALTLMHADPAFDWSLTSLGERVGMSRATLVRRFQEIVGTSPMAYLADWRLTKAYSLVRHTAMPLDHVAEATGYSSVRTLSRTFKRRHGYTPNELRRTYRARTEAQ